MSIRVKVEVVDDSDGPGGLMVGAEYFLEEGCAQETLGRFFGLCYTAVQDVITPGDFAEAMLCEIDEERHSELGFAAGTKSAESSQDAVAKKDNEH